MKRILIITSVFIVMVNLVTAQTDTVYVVKETSPAVTENHESSSNEEPVTTEEHVSYNHDVRDRFQFGIKAGANYSNVYDVTSENFAANFKVGFTSGVFLSIPIGKYLGVQPELMYSQRGYKSEGSILGVQYKITHTTGYIDIPLYLQLKPSDFITVLIGPQYSYLVHQDNNISTSLLSAQQQQDFDKINVRKNTFGLSGGLDINLGHIVVGGRAGWDLQDNNGDGSSISPRYRNFWYQTTLGVRF